jgi:hypothetical protein
MTSELCLSSIDKSEKTEIVIEYSFFHSVLSRTTVDYKNKISINEISAPLLLIIII